MKHARYLVLLAVHTLVSCGKPLGEYKVRSVKAVAAASEPDHRDERRELMLRVEFLSRIDLYAASHGGGGGLYVSASYCPYYRKQTLYIGETYYNDRSRYGPLRVLKRNVSSDGKVVETVVTDDPRPLKEHDTGQYAYTTYLAVARRGSAERPGVPKQPAYDLQRKPQDLCLRIEHPGYFLTPSQSQIFRVPVAMIQSALNAASRERQP